MPQRKAGQYTGANPDRLRLLDQWGPAYGGRALALQGVEVGSIGSQAALLDGGSNFGHQPQVEMQVVDGVQMRSQDLAALVEMAQVAAAVMRAGIAAAALLDGAGVFLVHRVADVEHAAAREQVTIAGVTCGH